MSVYKFNIYKNLYWKKRIKLYKKNQENLIIINIISGHLLKKSIKITTNYINIFNLKLKFNDIFCKINLERLYKILNWSKC